MIDVAVFEAALSEVKDAIFECGEWDRNESDEPFDTVLQRAIDAEIRLYEALGLPVPPALRLR